MRLPLLIVGALCVAGALFITASGGSAVGAMFCLVCAAINFLSAWVCSP